MTGRIGKQNNRIGLRLVVIGIKGLAYSSNCILISGKNTIYHSLG